jgi:peptidoglycan/xylan/chitin deacetylase (PgdA/CDA1 family)
VSQPLTIVTYHYVRPLARTPYPAIKALDLDDFAEQLAYLKRHYILVSGEELMAAVSGEWSLPTNAALLTFDDGYSDHFDYVFPLLDRERVPGCFFAPSAAVCDRKLLEVNRIHFILAAVQEPKALVDDVRITLERWASGRADHGLRSFDEYWSELAHPSRWDPAEVVFFKRMLQRALPEQRRTELSSELFARYVSNDETAFAEELYVDVDQLRCMANHGMYVGGHGHSHQWMSRLPADAQAQDIDISLDLLRKVGTPTDAWIMCYPYGDSNQELRDVLRSRGCVAAVTTEPQIARSDSDPLLLARLDTNDLPKNASAPPPAPTRSDRGWR